MSRSGGKAGDSSGTAAAHKVLPRGLSPSRQLLLPASGSPHWSGVPVKPSPQPTAVEVEEEDGSESEDSAGPLLKGNPRALGGAAAGGGAAAVPPGAAAGGVALVPKEDSLFSAPRVALVEQDAPMAPGRSPLATTTMDFIHVPIRPQSRLIGSPHSAPAGGRCQPRRLSGFPAGATAPAAAASAPIQTRGSGSDGRTSQCLSVVVVLLGVDPGVHPVQSGGRAAPAGPVRAAALQGAGRGRLPAPAGWPALHLRLCRRRRGGPRALPCTRPQRAPAARLPGRRAQGGPAAGLPALSQLPEAGFRSQPEPTIQLRVITSEDLFNLWG